jgi:hypothetical protein
MVAVPIVTAYAAADADAWDGLVGRSCNGTFMHTRRFISYHGDRFRDRSLVLTDRRGNVTGVFPAAADPADPGLVVSHPGLTYGGLVHDGSVRGESMIGAIGAIAGHYRAAGYQRLRYKAVPSIYHTVPAADDHYALFRLGARRHRSDLSATVDLASRGRVTQRRLRSRKQAEAAGVRTREDWALVADFWPVLEQNLARRHGARPVHSLAEIQLLHDRFGDEITLISAMIGDELVGGTVLFAAGPVLHMQYTATTQAGRDSFATDLVMEQAIGTAAERGFRFFDFGTCTVDEGRDLNQDLYGFKVSFGAGGVVYDHYELGLGPGDEAS